MENKKRIAGDGETHLPREIIHHIQSFLNEGGAARTSLLSKSWYSAWSTRPKLAFDLKIPKGSEFAKKTIQRYEDEKLRIQSLKVSQLNPNLDSKDLLLLAKELLVKAMKLGADDLHVSFSNMSSFVLPDEVLESKTLASLYFSGFTLNLPPMKKGLTFSKLKSLGLSHLTVKGDLIRDLISRCPSIETLILHDIESCYGEDVDMNGFEKLQLGKLEALLLSSSLKLEGSLARFSCLKELAIWGYNDMKDVRICSRSLEKISMILSSNKILTAEFDVPNLRKFELRGSPSSCLDFKSSRNEWESKIHLSCYQSDEMMITPSWFSSLIQLLKMLRNSRVSLSIGVDVDVNVNGGDGLPSLVVVETLRLSGKEVNSVFVDNLFSFFRPKRIIQDYVWYPNPRKKELLEVDCEKMVEEEMNVKVLEERFGKYSSLSWKALLEDSHHRPTVVVYEVIWNLDH